LKRKDLWGKKFVAVVGYRNSGKSTIIQSLSGCKSHSYKGLITDSSVNLSVYVHAASPQEDPRTNEGAFTRILNRVKADASCQGLLIAVQPTLTRERLRMERMFEIARQAGLETYAFVIEFPFDKKRLAQGGIGNFENIKERILKSDPKAKISSIDGRRFAILNSEAIRSIARFPY
jgi:energy-coupling factor transporter ATP-binding protein EcfA2